ncbi:MAG: 2-oxoglutarate dehydrogenase subunit E1, partial [Verrucomicrobia bacterium]|nr:2-oxoglutarate dehydrogenase subunit E1 [Verrucomicrobiota bacterium]
MEESGGPMPEFPDYAQLANLQMIEELYSRYLSNPDSVDLSWRHFFEGIDFAAYLTQRGAAPTPDSSNLRVYDLVQAFRKYGHLSAHFNPIEQRDTINEHLNLEKLGFFPSELDQEFPTLGFCGKPQAALKDIIAALKEIYCGRIGFEFMDLDNPEL